MPLSRRAYEIAATATALATFAVMAWELSGVHGMVLRGGQPIFGDFIGFWTAGRAALDGHVAELHQRALLFPYQQALAPELRLYTSWNAPPTFLLVACVLALLPFPVSALLFLASTLALYLYAARKLLPDARALILAATAPAVVYHIGTIQAGLLIAGLLGLALYWLDARPRMAGVLIGLLAIKPHLALLWPIWLALSGRWRVFAAAAATAVSLTLIAGFVFGFDAYARFVGNLATSQSLVTQQQITTPAYASLYASLLGLGAPPTLALAMHALSAVTALIVAVLVFLRGDRVLGGAALCAATMLVSPYLFFYDGVILVMGAALLGPPRNQLDMLAAIFAWGAGLTVAVGAIVPLPVCPFAAWLLLGAAMRRAGILGARPGQAQHT